MQLTDEQLAIVDAARDHTDLCVVARAGTGKTSTNVAIAEDQPDKRFLYLAFNKRVADEGKRRFGSNVTVKSAHSLAFGAVGRHFGSRIKTSPYQIKHDLTDRFASAWESAGGARDQERLALYAALQAIDALPPPRRPSSTTTNTSPKARMTAASSAQSRAACGM